MYNAQFKVRWFHEIFNCYRSDTPTVIPFDVQTLRLRLIREETKELDMAMVEGDLPAIADAIGDLLYVVLGTAVAHGINIEPVFEAIHDANLAKRGGPIRADGKILKPADWTPPDIESILVNQGWRK